MSKKPLACFTIARNESFWLPRWLKHYAATGADLHVLDHESDDGSTDNYAGRGPAFRRYAVTRPHTDDVGWMLQTVEKFFAELAAGYERVIFAECDEFLVPDPLFCPTLARYLAEARPGPVTATGFDLCQRFSDLPLDPAKTLMCQRGWVRNDRWDKTLIADRPMRWEVGFHRPHAEMGIAHRPDPTLFLIHGHYMDRGVQWERLAKRRAGRDPFPNDWGSQNKTSSRMEFDADFDRATAGAGAIPEYLWDVL